MSLLFTENEPTGDVVGFVCNVPGIYDTEFAALDQARAKVTDEFVNGTSANFRKQNPNKPQLDHSRDIYVKLATVRLIPKNRTGVEEDFRFGIKALVYQIKA